MSLEDSGVIDLFALQRGTSGPPAAQPAPVLAPLASGPLEPSAPPPAYTTDVEGSGRLALDSSASFDDAALANPFARKGPSARVLVGGAIAAAGLVVAVAVAAISGGRADGVKSAAGGPETRAVATAVTKDAAPTPTYVPPPPVVVSAAIPSAASPSTGALIADKPPSRASRGAAPAHHPTRLPSGPKLVKVQSGGTTGK